MIGKELAHDTTLSWPKRLYIKLFGIPINGLRIRARRVLPYMTSQSKNILDSGCGQGIFTFETARRFPGSTVTGMDVNSELIERNRRIANISGLKNCRFESSDIADINNRNCYDLILSIDVLEHIADDVSVLRSYREVLADGGELLLHVPGLYRRWPLFGWKANFAVEGHCRPGYSMEEIIAKIEDAGLTVVENYYTYGWIETMTNNISYMITGASMKRKHLYALVFPVLLFVSHFGKNSRPERGAGIFVKARKIEKQ